MSVDGDTASLYLKQCKVVSVRLGLIRTEVSVDGDTASLYLKQCSVVSVRYVLVRTEVSVDGDTTSLYLTVQCCVCTICFGKDRSVSRWGYNEPIPKTVQCHYQND